MEQKSILNTRYIDGYKGVAIILVVIGHLDILNLGSVSNCVFFVISGFLAVSPFSNNNSRFHSFKDVFYYYFKKIIRIVPSLYIVLFLVLVLTHERFMPISKNISNFFFYDMYAHLWFIQQIMFLYFVTPLITSLFSLLSRLSKVFNSYLVKAVLAGTFAILFRYFAPATIFSFKYSTGRISIYLHNFLIGVAAAFLYRFLVEHSLLERFLKYRFFISFAQILIVLLLVFTSDQILTLIDPSLSGFYFGREHPLICSSIVALLLLLMIIDENSLLSRLLSLKPFAFFGKISLQLYLIHWFLIPYIGIENLLLKSVILVVLSTISASILYWINDLIAKRIKLPQPKSA